MAEKKSDNIFWIDLACEVIRVLTGHGVKNAAAVLIAKEIVTAITRQCGGQLVYITKGLAADYAHKAAGICGEFDGRNHKELAEKYEVSLDFVYKTLKRNKPKKIKMVSRRVDTATVANLIAGIGDQA